MSLLLRSLVLGALGAQVAPGQAPAPPRRVDTAAVVAAAWRAAASLHAGLRPAVLAPGAFGSRVVAALRARGVPVRADTARAGPDTVVFRVTGLEPQAREGARVALQSGWEVHRGGCAYASSNAETVAVACRRGQCRAAPAASAVHGDAGCRPLPTPAGPR